MATPLRTLLAALPFLAVFACGGRVGLIDGGDGGKDAGTCPSPGTLVAGGACTTDGLVCASSYDTCGDAITCECSGGAWACSGAGPSCPPPPPTCGVAGAPECPDAQPPGCPVPAEVVQGDTCSVDSQDTCSSATSLYDCSGNFIGYVQCECFGGQWSCESTGLDCPDASPPPPTGCPDPQSVEQGVACFEALQQCPGNPTDCDGAIFYDAFECDNGAWNDVAVTQCDSDGGFADAGAGGKGQ